MTVSSGAGITLRHLTLMVQEPLFQNITFATGGVSITVGNDVGVLMVLVMLVAQLVTSQHQKNNGMSKTVGITDDEGTGVSLSTTFGGVCNFVTM